MFLTEAEAREFSKITLEFQIVHTWQSRMKPNPKSLKTQCIQWSFHSHLSSIHEVNKTLLMLQSFTGPFMRDQSQIWPEVIITTLRECFFFFLSWLILGSCWEIASHSLHRVHRRSLKCLNFDFGKIKYLKTLTIIWFYGKVLRSVWNENRMCVHLAYLNKDEFSRNFSGALKLWCLQVVRHL